jgi:TatD DNase family protein
MLVDSHCHLIGSYLEKGSFDSVMGRARQEGVQGFIAVGTGLQDSEEVVNLAHRFEDIRASVGVHPHEAKTWESSSSASLEILARDPAVCFVGETGLDWHYDLSPRSQQEEAFRAQIRVAKRVGKPLMVHTREAREDTLRILEEEGADSVGGVFHCFSEDLTFARRVIDSGYYLSFSGIVTFKKAEAIQEVARWAPADRILVETDSPFLAPVPFRGKTNEPAYVVHVAKAVAALRGVSFEDLADQTTRNLEALCGWAPTA